MKTIVHKGHRLQRPINDDKNCVHKLKLQYIFYSPAVSDIAETTKESPSATSIIGWITNNCCDYAVCNAVL